MFKIAFVGTFAARLAPRVGALLGMPAESLVVDEASAAPLMHDVDVVVTLAFTKEMAAAAQKLKLIGTTTASTLTGSVKRARVGGDGKATIQSITGAADIHNSLPRCGATTPSACFEVGSISAAVVDRLLEADVFTVVKRR